MWNDVKHQRLNELRRRDAGTLTADERHALDRLLHELEQAEWGALRPTLSRLRQEQGQMQDELAQSGVQNAVLAALAERYADLLARANEQLANLRQEREALRAEYERALR